jgi:nucleotide-binding universal stress UspA family protein
MFERILVPTDGSQPALHAARLAGALVQKSGGQLVLLTVVGIPQSLVMADGVGENMLEEYVDETSHEALAPALDAVREFGVEPTVRTEVGSAADAILEVARELNADIVIMGKRGQGELRGFLLGSVCDRVAHHLGVPLMLVP